MKPPKDENITNFFINTVGGKLKKATLFPMAAIKCFRGKGIQSGNLLFAGPKIGQSSSNFFYQTLCTQMTERVPAVMKPFIKKFYKYSKNPLSLGVSDFCKFDQDGEEFLDDGTKKVNFPYVIMLQPVYKNEREHSEEKTSFDDFIDDLMQIPSGTILFDIFVCPTPSCALDPTQIHRIGRVITTTEMIPSTPNDGLFFRHQKKEEDFDLCPHWRKQSKAKCSPNGGKTVGTIDRLAGATILGALIKSNKFLDFEVRKS